MKYLVLRDLKNFITDPRALFLALAFPLILVYLVVSVYPPQGTGAGVEFSFGLASGEGEGGLSWEIISLWDQEGLPVRVLDFPEARRQLHQEEIQAFLYFPGDFTRRIYQGENPILEVYTDPEMVRGRMAALRLTRGLAYQLSYAVKGLELMERQQGLSRAEILDRLRSRGETQVIPGLAEPVVLDLQQVGPLVPLDRINWAMPAFFTMFVFLALGMSSVEMVRDRETQVLERLVVSGVGKRKILGARFASSLIKGLIQVLVLWGAGIFLFDLYPGPSLLTLFLLSAAFVGAAASFSLYVAARASRSSSAFSLVVLASLVMAPLGGCWWPIYLVPGWMRALGMLTPHYWGNQAFHKILLLGGDLASVNLEIAVLVVFSALLGRYAARKFKTT